MKTRMVLRQLTDKSFTILTVVSVILIVLVLVVVLGPMLGRGASAVVFKGTVEFRKLHYSWHQRGSEESIRKETAETEKARQSIYVIVDRFKRGIDTTTLVTEARKKYREYKKYLQYQNLPAAEYQELTQEAKNIRDTLSDVYNSTNKHEIVDSLDALLRDNPKKRFQDTPAGDLLIAADEYKAMVQKIDLTHREQYISELAEVQDLLRKLFGPRPEEPTPALIMEQYGATRWDMAQKYLHRLVWIEQWIQIDPDKPMVKKLVPRAQHFAGTELEGLFTQIEGELPRLLQPRWTFYWQYFIDDSTEGYFFGGVGPEILGTLLFTILAMLFAVPIGVISAAYLVEYAGENIVVRLIRTCVNTLAGVPSIVFALFGLAFFVKVLMPALGQESKPCILTGSLTLAVLVLPVIIRAGEEAIRSVPQTYKEASLALGAGKFRTLVTVILPVAMPGILTGIILSLSRAAGETAPLLFAGAVAAGPIAKSIFEPSRVLSYGSYDIAVGDRYAAMVPHKQFGMVVTLIVLVLCLNILAIFLRSRVSKKLRGQ